MFINISKARTFKKSFKSKGFEQYVISIWAERPLVRALMAAKMPSAGKCFIQLVGDTAASHWNKTLT